MQCSNVLRKVILIHRPNLLQHNHRSLLETCVIRKNYVGRHILLFDYRSNGGDNNGWGILIKVIRLDNQNRSFAALNTAFVIAKIVEEDVSTLDIIYLPS